MTLYIKNMTDSRCKMIVKEELKNLGLLFVIVDTGIVEILEDVSECQLETLREELFGWGFELQSSKKAVLVEKIKQVVNDMIRSSDERLHVNYSDYISEKLNYDYTYLSNIFSEVSGITIQHYIITIKIEMAKKLIRYNELNLTEISYRLHYSSVAHLSNQFKKITGTSPSSYRLRKQKNIIPLKNPQMALAT
jgi:AraC-like DNA-binding protein